MDNRLLLSIFFVTLALEIMGTAVQKNTTTTVPVSGMTAPVSTTVVGGLSSTTNMTTPMGGGMSSTTNMTTPASNTTTSMTNMTTPMPAMMDGDMSNMTNMTTPASNTTTSMTNMTTPMPAMMDGGMSNMTNMTTPASNTTTSMTNMTTPMPAMMDGGMSNMTNMTTPASNTTTSMTNMTTPMPAMMDGGMSNMTNMTTPASNTTTSMTNMTTPMPAMMDGDMSNMTNMTTPASNTTTSMTNMTTPMPAMMDGGMSNMTNMTTPASNTTTSMTNMTTASPATTVAPTLATNIPVSSLDSSISRTGCGDTQLCADEPSNCNPSANDSCFFVAVTQQSNDVFNVSCSGQSEGYIFCAFSSDNVAGGNDTSYVCANKRGTVAFFTALLNNNILTVTELNVNSVRGRVDGSTIQCTFEATLPASPARAGRTGSLIVGSGSFNSSGNSLGAVNVQIRTNEVDLKNPNATITSLESSGHSVTLQQSVTQALLAIVCVLGLNLL
ncbi:uncharacterized protein KZ484_018535 [Pholidichthys leucotaenia]